MQIMISLFFLDMRNLQQQVKKVFCYQKLFWPFAVWVNCSSDLKKISNSRPSASNFKSFSRSLEHIFLTVCQNNFGNKIPFPNSQTFLNDFDALYLPTYNCNVSQRLHFAKPFFKIIFFIMDNFLFQIISWLRFS